MSSFSSYEQYKKQGMAETDLFGGMEGVYRLDCLICYQILVPKKEEADKTYNWWMKMRLETEAILPQLEVNEAINEV